MVKWTSGFFIFVWQNVRRFFLRNRCSFQNQKVTQAVTQKIASERKHTLKRLSGSQKRK